MEHIGDYMSQSMRQYDCKQRAGLLRRLRDLIRKKRLYEMAKKLHKETEPTQLDGDVHKTVEQELDRMLKESERDFEQLIERLGNDELIHEIQKRLSMSDKELDALTISDDDVERVINSPLFDRKNNAETTPKRPK